MANCITLEDDIRRCLVAETGGNTDGLVSSLYITGLNNVDTIAEGDVGTFLLATDIVMQADTRTAAEVTAGDPAEAVPGVFRQWDFKETGAIYTSENEGDEEDGNYLHKVVAKIPKINPLSNAILNAAGGGKEHAILIRDKNNYPWLLGDQYSGARVKTTETTDGNGYNVEITWRKGRKLYSYTGAIPMA